MVSSVTVKKEGQMATEEWREKLLESLRSVAKEGQMAEAHWTIKEGCYEVVTEENRV